MNYYGRFEFSDTSRLEVPVLHVSKYCNIVSYVKAAVCLCDHANIAGPCTHQHQQSQDQVRTGPTTTHRSLLVTAGRGQSSHSTLVTVYTTE